MGIDVSYVNHAPWLRQRSSERLKFAPLSSSSAISSIFLNKFHQISPIYPLVMTNMAIENGSVETVSSPFSNMAMFHGHVRLPDLVGGFNPSEKYESHLGRLFPTEWNN